MWASAPRIRSLRPIESRSASADSRPSSTWSRSRIRPCWISCGCHTCVELPVDLRRVGQHRGELEDVAVDLELDPGHVVEDVAEPRLELARVAHGEVDGVEPDRRMVVGQLRDVLGQPEAGGRGVLHETRQKATFLDVVDSAPSAVRMGTGPGRAVIAAAALGSGIAFLDGTVVNVALRTIGEDLDASLTQLQWITNGYLLSLASLILLGGSLGDRFGRRRVFVIGTVWFAVASLLCGLAPNPEVLIAARVLQGIGGALLTPGSLAMIQGAFAHEDRAPAIGAWSGLTSISGGDRAVRRRRPGAVRRLAVDLPDQPPAGRASPSSSRSAGCPRPATRMRRRTSTSPGRCSPPRRWAARRTPSSSGAAPAAWVAVVVGVARRGRLRARRVARARADAGARDLPRPDLQRVQRDDPAGLRRPGRAGLLRDHRAADGERVRRARGRRGVRADDRVDAACSPPGAAGWACASAPGSR